MNLHPNHDWYVSKLVRALRVRDFTLVQSLRADLRKMSKEHRDAIMSDYRTDYKAAASIDCYAGGTS